MLQSYVRAYPFDLVDEGIEIALDRLCGEVGVSGVSIHAASAPVVQLRSRDLEHRIYRTRGGMFFHPDERHYSATRCKPIVSSRIKGRDPVERIAEACSQRGMKLRVVVSASMVGRLAQRYPEMAAKNALGDRSHIALCLAHPDVEALVRGLLADLSSRHELAGIVVSDFVIGWPEAVSHDLSAPVAIGELETALLATCFCESCHRRAMTAGVDVAAAQRSVQTILQSSMDRGTPATGKLDSITGDNKPLADYYHWRSDTLTAQLNEMMNACQYDLLLDTLCDSLGSENRIDREPAAASGIITRIDSCDDLTKIDRRCEQRHEVLIPARLAVGKNAPKLVSLLATAVDSGIIGAEFDDYALLSDAALATIKQAIRFARRTTNQS